jgi:hypothetical protein
MVLEIKPITIFEPTTTYGFVKPAPRESNKVLVFEVGVYNRNKELS